MSRRKGEFEHRTSIFEGAFRAWSHLGGLEPHDLKTKSTSELDPIDHPIENDPRLTLEKESKDQGSEDNSDSNDNKKTQNSGREYPYEPLPRSGLAHPYIQDILSQWLGPDADKDATELGLSTLRTWWQHRCKGESGSAIAALSTNTMQSVLACYIRHFFTFAHCLVVTDGEKPPRTLHAKMKELEKANAKKRKKRKSYDEDNNQAMKAAMTFRGGYAGNNANANVNVNLSYNSNNGSVGGGGGLLDRLQASQRRLLAADGGIPSLTPNNGFVPHIPKNNAPKLDMKGRCRPGKIDLPYLVKRVNSAATQLAYRGSADTPQPKLTPASDPSKYGDPNVMPVILISQNNDIQILMTVDGITCSHCVKIVETVLKGSPGSNRGSPIDGLLNAVADQQLNAILIKIRTIAAARRIAHEAARNLNMVGYTACTKSIDIRSLTKGQDETGEKMTLQKMYTVFEAVSNINPKVGDVIQWSAECRCPMNNVMRMNCPSHQQMSPHIFSAFDQAQALVSEIVSGCGKKYGKPCNAGASCFCKDSSITNGEPHMNMSQKLNVAINQPFKSQKTNGMVKDPMKSHQKSLPSVEVQPTRNIDIERLEQPSVRTGGVSRRHSLNSNSTGRAMSELSNLSFDWDNMDDFDVSVDHSEGINDDIVNQPVVQQERINDNVQNPQAKVGMYGWRVDARGMFV